MNKERAIRPTDQYLRSLPTLAEKTPEQGVDDEVRELAKQLGVTFKLELKLVTESFEYWLCTAGAETANEQVPEAWIVGYVTMVPRKAEEDQTGGFSYGPQSARQLQGRDYLKMLGDRMEELKRKQAASSSREIEDEIKATQREINDVLASMGHKPPSINRDDE